MFTALLDSALADGEWWYSCSCLCFVKNVLYQLRKSAGPTQRRSAQGDEENQPPPHVISNINVHGFLAKELSFRNPFFWNITPCH